MGKKPPSEHTRLARAFAIPPTKPGMAVGLASGFGAIGLIGATIAFVPAIAAIAAVGAYAVTDRRVIAKGLRELDTWGFPIDGYRGWLLADEPTFDVDLLREIDVDMIITSCAAIDPAIVVRRISERSFRVVTRRIALPGHKDGDPPIHLGDRRLLRELYDRMLSPLHADIGIVAMRMGDRATLTSILPATPLGDDGQPAMLGMGAFREPAKAAPPALQALVHSGGTALSLTEETRKLPFRSERVLHAAGRSPAGIGTVLAITAGGAFSGVQLGPIGAGIGAIGGFIGGVAAAIANNRRNVRIVSALTGWHGFEIDGYDDWLIAGRPLFDIELSGPLDRDYFRQQMNGIVAFSGEQNSTVRWVTEISWLEETVVRVETRPTLIQPTSSRIRAFYGGSHILFQQCLTTVLIPLHAQVKIKTVHMGGYVERRV
ncbi:MAG: hypothetical protein H0T42_28675 [Deltaproteobacteria bacterium]|nr:hypothetical protein [Deltaproteobacteria bacterium]